MHFSVCVCLYCPVLAKYNFSYLAFFELAAFFNASVRVVSCLNFIPGPFYVGDFCEACTVI
jgi:hypothetical protein